LKQTAILIPALMLIGWTLLVLLTIPYQRFKAYFAGKVTAHDFKFGESCNVPEEVCIPNRNLMNLLEVPVLFYAVCLMLYVTQTVDGLAVALAWVYVGLRGIHSLIHLSYNHVFHRFAVFATSNVVMALLWLKLLLALVA
jgi:hypothetical protein